MTNEDVLSRLRETRWCGTEVSSLLNDAADEIERLRKVQDIALTGVESLISSLDKVAISNQKVGEALRLKE